MALISFRTEKWLSLVNDRETPETANEFGCATPKGRAAAANVHTRDPEKTHPDALRRRLDTRLIRRSLARPT